MKLSTLFLALIFGLGLVSAPAYADSSETIKEQTTKLKDYGGVGDLESYCKSKIKVSIDEKSFSKAIALPENKDKIENLYRQCSKPIRAVKEWCAKGYKKNVQEQITSYVCRYDAGKPKMGLKKGVLTMTTDWKVEPNDWSLNAVGGVLKDGDFNVIQAALIKNDMGRIKDAMADMKRRCGHDVKWKVDWKSFSAEIDKRTGSNNLPAIWQQCSAPLMGLEAMCTNGQSDLMKSQVDSFECRFDKKTEADMVLKGKKLVLTSNFDTKGLKEWGKMLVWDTLRDGEFSVNEAAFIRDEEEHLQRLYSTLVDGKCKTKIKWAIDWKSFKGEMDKRLATGEKTSIYSACGVPLNRLADVCGSDSKNKVKKKISSYKCAYGGPKKQKLSLKKGKFEYRVDFAADDAYGAVDKFLVKKKVIKKKPAPKKLSPKELSQIRRILGEGANTQQCYKGCARRCTTQSCKNTCRSGCQ